MLIVPELKTVFILVPRTGSGTFFRSVQTKYPGAMLLYRHMEADGVPIGYDRWERVGFVRQPHQRLWSLWNFLQNFKMTKWVEESHAIEVQQEMSRPFEDWLLNSKFSFTRASNGIYHHPTLSRIHGHLPDARCSQFNWLRPDLGTKVWHYEQLEQYAKMIDVPLAPERRNASNKPPLPPLSEAAKSHIEKYFQWDLDMYGMYRRDLA